MVLLVNGDGYIIQSDGLVIFLFRDVFHIGFSDVKSCSKNDQKKDVVDNSLGDDPYFIKGFFTYRLHGKSINVPSSNEWSLSFALA